jgi:hypothetical protein
MSTSAVFRKSEAGPQTVFGTPATPTFTLPFSGDYVDAGDFHEAALDSGRWLPTTLINRVSDHGTFTLNGAAIFELLPIFARAGFNDITPVGANPYTYTYHLNLSAPGTPLPYTFRFGAGENIGATGPAIQIADSYCSQFVLTGNLNDRSVTFSSNWFGNGVDNDDGAGYDFAATAMPTAMQMLSFPYGTLEYQDTLVTGNNFLTMTAYQCKLMDWTLTVNTGLEPQWAGDANSLTMCGAFIGMPSVEFACTLRTDMTSYQAVWMKANTREPVYQEIKFTSTGTDGRLATFYMTGRWLPVESAHAVSNNEVVMNATFRASGDPTQTTTPHAFGYSYVTKWSTT